LTLSATGGTNNYALKCYSGSGANIADFQSGINNLYINFISTDGSAQFGIYGDAVFFQALDSLANGIVFLATTTSSNDMVISAAKNVGINCTPAATTKLDVLQAKAGVVDTYGVSISVTGANTTNRALTLSASGATTNYWIYADTANYWKNNGDICASRFITGGSFDSSKANGVNFNLYGSTYYGKISTHNADIWSLGYDTTIGAIGLAVLTWIPTGVGIGLTPNALNKLDILQTSTTTLSTGCNILHNGAITGTGIGAKISKTGICSVESIGCDLYSTGASLLNTGLKITVSGGTKNNALEAIGAGIGIVLASPDGTRYLATMANGGTWAIAAA
jgi:hypothetical protein